MGTSYLLYTLQRRNPQTGFKETVKFTGDIKKKPKGWKVVKKEWANVYTDEHGLTGKNY